MYSSNRTNHTDSDHVYLDLTMVNNDSVGDKAPVPLIFEETRNSPVIQNPEDYYISVVRFSLDTATLPLFIPQVKLGQSNPNDLIYSITMTYEYSGTVYEQQEFIQFQSQNSFVPTPSSPTVQQDVSTSYYYINNYNRFVRMINTTFQDCYDNLNGQVITAGGTLPSANAPFMEFNPDRDTAIINADKLGYDESLINPISIYFNTPLFNLFSSFEAVNNGFQVTNGKNYRINIINDRDSNIYVLPSGDYVQMYQEYSTVSQWTPISSMVFTTSLVPIEPTQVSKPLIYNSEQGLTTSGNNANISAILTDFIADDFQYKPYLLYIPSAEYRYFDLKGNTPLTSIQISCFWKDKFGNLNPLQTNAQQHGTMKILFRKKALQTIDHLEK